MLHFTQASLSTIEVAVVMAWSHIPVALTLCNLPYSRHEEKVCVPQPVPLRDVVEAAVQWRDLAFLQGGLLCAPWLPAAAYRFPWRVHVGCWRLARFLCRRRRRRPHPARRVAASGKRRYETRRGPVWPPATAETRRWLSNPWIFPTCTRRRRPLVWWNFQLLFTTGSSSVGHVAPTVHFSCVHVAKTTTNCWSSCNFMISQYNLRTKIYIYCVSSSCLERKKALLRSGVKGQNGQTAWRR